MIWSIRTNKCQDTPKEKGVKMKKAFVFLLLSITVFATSLTTTQAATHIGEKATVCGVVYGGFYAKNSRGQPTFVNLDGDYPNQKFTIVIWGENRHKFDAPERAWRGKNICVKGYIDSYRGVPQIVVDTLSQLKSTQ